MHECMIMFLTLLFFSFCSLSYTRGPFSRSISISQSGIEIFFNLPVWYRDLFQSPSFYIFLCAYQNGHIWAQIVELNLHPSFLFFIQCNMNVCFMLLLHHMLIASNHNYSTSSGFFIFFMPSQVACTSQVPIFTMNYNTFSINHFIFTYHMFILFSLIFLPFI